MRAPNTTNAPAPEHTGRGARRGHMPARWGYDLVLLRGPPARGGAFALHTRRTGEVDTSGLRWN